MGKVAIDFGTCNTVLARWVESKDCVETIFIPQITQELTYQNGFDKTEQTVYLIPSLIHYSETEILIGNQVVSRGLADHPHTFRWMKRDIARGNLKVRHTPVGHKNHIQAGEDFLKLVLNYCRNEVSFETDEFTFTVPVEAFDNFQDWIWRVTETLRIRKVRLLDEPTSCILGYRDTVRENDRFVIVDFGGGTLDVSSVRLDPHSTDEIKAVPLGKAGQDLGGMDIDRWIVDDFCHLHDIQEKEFALLNNMLYVSAESMKQALSNPNLPEAELTILSRMGTSVKIHKTVYKRTCNNCERGIVVDRNAPGYKKDPGNSCLGCVLLEHGFIKQVKDTVTRSLEDALIRSAMRRDNISRVLVTGGTSLIPCVRKFLLDEFPEKVEYYRPFDTVVTGACRGIIVPILQHDYSVEGYDPSKKEYVFVNLFRRGTEYPVTKPVKFYANGNTDGQTRLGLKIYEVSQMKKRSGGGSIFDKDGVFKETSQVVTENIYICLNPDNPTFINADPEIVLKRDAERFLCSFTVDEKRMLLVTVYDRYYKSEKLPLGKPIYFDYPVVRL